MFHPTRGASKWNSALGDGRGIQSHLANSLNDQHIVLASDSFYLCFYPEEWKHSSACPHRPLTLSHLALSNLVLWMCSFLFLPASSNIGVIAFPSQMFAIRHSYQQQVLSVNRSILLNFNSWFSGGEKSLGFRVSWFPWCALHRRRFQPELLTVQTGAGAQSAFSSWKEATAAHHV